MSVTACADWGSILFIELLVVDTILKDSVCAINVVLVLTQVHTDDRTVGLFHNRLLLLYCNLLFVHVSCWSDLADSFLQVFLELINFLGARLDTGVEIVGIIFDPVQIDPPLMQVRQAYDLSRGIALAILSHVAELVVPD